MSGRFLLLALSLAFHSLNAQFIALPGTAIKALNSPDIVIKSAGNVALGDDKVDLSGAKVVIELNGANLSGTGILIHSHSARLPIDEIRLTGHDYELRGTWAVTKALTLTAGKLTVNNAASPVGRLFYTGNSDAITASSSSYIIGPMFTAGSSQTRTYPIGNAKGYYPVQLIGINDATALLRMECISSSASTAPININELTTQFPENIDSLITDRYYNFKIFYPPSTSGSFSGAPISLSLDGTSIDFSKHLPIVVELDTASGAINNLQGVHESITLGGTPTEVASSGIKTTSYGGKYMIATSKDVAIKIHKLITPNGDGKNDELYIEGIELYSTNKVTLLDRWGGVYLTAQNFKNEQTTGIDYTKLVNGNYICIVEYTDTKGTHKPKPQMITVLK